MTTTRGPHGALTRLGQSPKQKKNDTILRAEQHGRVHSQKHNITGRVWLVCTYHETSAHELYIIRCLDLADSASILTPALRLRGDQITWQTDTLRSDSLPGNCTFITPQTVTRLLVLHCALSPRTLGMCTFDVSLTDRYMVNVGHKKNSHVDFVP